MYLLALVSGVKEQHSVMQALFAKLQLVKLKTIVTGLGAEFTTVHDTKMAWMINGKSHGGVHSCLYCPWTASQGLGVSFAWRTANDDVRDWKLWKHDTGELSFAKAKAVVKNYTNCLRYPLNYSLHNSPDDTIIALCRPWPLHLKLRNGNTLLSDLSVAADTVYVNFLQSCGVVEENYHKELEGRPITKILRSVQKLREIIASDVQATAFELDNLYGSTRVQLDDILTPENHRAAVIRTITAAHPAAHYPRALETLNILLLRACRTDYDPAVHEAATDYRLALQQLGRRPTVSMHVLIDEVPKYCSRFNCGLNRYSEEASESMHHEYKVYMERWSVPGVGSPGHAAGLRSSMAALNVAHAVAPSE